jgi:hypothetical protein
LLISRDCLTHFPSPAPLPLPGRQVILVNHLVDEGLCRAEAAAEEAVAAVAPFGDAARVQALAGLVADRLGGPYASPERLARAHAAASGAVKAAARSAIVPLGQLQIGAGRHRALLFKVLADALGMPCALLRGASYCGDEDAAAVVVRVDGAEWQVDLVCEPGNLLPTPAQQGATFGSTAFGALQQAASAAGGGYGGYGGGGGGGSVYGGGYGGAGRQGTTVAMAASTSAPSRPPRGANGSTPFQQGRVQAAHKAAGAGGRGGGGSSGDLAGLGDAGESGSVISQVSGMPSLTLSEDGGALTAGGGNPSARRPRQQQGQGGGGGNGGQRGGGQRGGGGGGGGFVAQPERLPSGMGFDVTHAGAWEIDPAEITLGPRIGIGSYGEVYKVGGRAGGSAGRGRLGESALHLGSAAVLGFAPERAVLTRSPLPRPSPTRPQGTWRGTEVAVKRFLEQNLSPQLVQVRRGPGRRSRAGTAGAGVGGAYGCAAAALRRPLLTARPRLCHAPPPL